MFLTRFIGNVFFFIFYFLIILWAGIRRLVNEDANIPGTLLYIATILISLQSIFLLYLNAVSGELPMTALKDSITTVLSYWVPLVIFSYLPNCINLIPSDSVRIHS
jgi:divalent metal cation (Fe/Co/Zn/Cd) transporter